MCLSGQFALGACRLRYEYRRVVWSPRVTGADNQYVFPLRDTGSSSPIWDLVVVERTSAAGNEPPYLIDPVMLGVLFLGAARFETDPYSGFANNTTRIRCELNCLFHIRQATGARRLAAT